MACPKDLLIIEFTETFGNIKVDMVAMFNSTCISEEKVREFITKYGTHSYSKDIVIMTKQQYGSLSGTLNDFYDDLLMEQKEQM